MAKRQVPHWQCPRSQALSISSAAWRRLASRAGRSLRERILLQVSLYAIRAKKSRGGPGRPRTRTARRRRNSQIANDSLGFSAPERSKRKHTSLGHFLCIRLPQKKQVFQAHYDQRSAGHPCKEVGYDIKNDPLGVLCCVGWFAVCAASLAYLIYWIVMRAK